MNREPLSVSPKGRSDPSRSPQGERKEEGGIEKLKAGPLMVRAYLSVRATGGAVFFPLRGRIQERGGAPSRVKGTRDVRNKR